jgi:tRNA(fMet)-specific endonuclease VapC
VPRLYLLDTNILSHLVRRPQGPVADHIADVGEANVLTSVIVACELRYGAAKRGSKKLTRQVEAVLSAMTIKPLESDVERVCVHSCGPREATREPSTRCASRTMSLSSNECPL